MKKMARDYMKHPETGELLMPGQIYFVSDNYQSTKPQEPEKISEDSEPEDEPEAEPDGEPDMKPEAEVVEMESEKTVKATRKARSSKGAE